ncbi:MAG: carboxypeptidase-like regulatory domain-containing protein [Planctomycetaceae bacterium]|jgi:hypothetical protein|nr:carboxypeptidase-like regulatory domain-containing protein [Planctomycetaceae bacterium]
MRFTFYCWVCILLFVVMMGCSQSNKPKDFPNLVPVKITVIDGTTPIEGVSVVLMQTDTGTSLVAGGNTDKAGVLNVTTSQATYQAKGCPVGKYKVTLSKSPKLPSEKTREEINQMTPEETDAYTKIITKEAKQAKPIIPPSLSSITTTKLEVEIPSGGTEITININEYW